jgi:cytochrome c biogenesis protein
MRFAVSLLVVLAIASVIGTVLKQNEPYTNYMVEFGPFWFQPFEWLGLYQVYHASWFLAILAFLVLSTSLCIYRQLPGILRDVRHYREEARLASLRAMPLHAEYQAAEVGLASAVAAHWRRWGYSIKQHDGGDVHMLAAKKGGWRRLGYLFAHGGLVVICVGGLLDGNLGLKLMQLTGLKEVEIRNGIPQSQIPESRRLPASNLSFKGNLELAEGEAGDVAFVNAGRGYMVQELPFVLRLKRFHIEHYSTGQPKLFASDIEVRDKATGRVTTATVKVNHPLIVEGIAIYQANFGDGGSPLSFSVWDWFGGSTTAMPLAARSLSRRSITLGEQPYTLEFGELRVFNIEGEPPSREAEGLAAELRDAHSVRAAIKMRNLGPSITFKLRDAQGQALEYQNYLAPFSEAGRLYLMSGVRREVGAPFEFIRLPLDESATLARFMRLRAVLFDSRQHAEIARRLVQRAREGGAVSAAMGPEFEQSVVWVLGRFAEGGFKAMERFLDARVPADKRQDVAQTYIKLMQGAVVEAMAMADARIGQTFVLDDGGQRYRFLMDSLVALSGAFEYGSPVYLQPTGFTEVKSSGFMLTRAPGKSLVYLGSLLMVIGLFCMFYIRENRLWLRFADGGAVFAMSANRKDVDTEREFARLRAELDYLFSRPTTLVPDDRHD